MLECCNADPLGPSLTAACSNASNFILFTSLLNSLIRTNDKISGICERVKPVECPDDVYDYVVIGGGAAGSVVASRLSEISEWTTLVLEAGDDETAGMQIPGFATTFLKTESLSWKFATTNEPHACRSTNNSCEWPSGKNLAGNSGHNGMMYVRGIESDYDHWAALGNEGWSWEDVKPYFLKSEDNGEIARVGREYHATGGLLSVERFPYTPPIADYFLQAAVELGYGLTEDVNGAQKTGMTVVQTTSKDGVRHSSSRSFVWPVRDRENLHIALGSHVTKILIENGTAVGVQFYKNNQLKTVRVNKEVILCAGVINSPQILLLSGIGPREHLESVGVPLVLDKPGVGENLHDHPGTVIEMTVNRPDVYENDWAIASKYLEDQTGPMSSLGLPTLVGMFSLNSSNPNHPDIQTYGGGYAANCAPGQVRALRSDGKYPMSFVSSYLRPKSRGSVTLASNDPVQLANIVANFLNDPDDLAKMVEGVKIVLNLFQADALKPLNITMTNLPLEACSQYEYPGDEHLACFVQQIPWALYHQGGTCKMGNSSDPMAVVDPRLRVYGIKGLRVADTSIMPVIPSGNTAAPAMMIGERVADFIKQDEGVL